MSARPGGRGSGSPKNGTDSEGKLTKAGKSGGGSGTPATITITTTTTASDSKRGAGTSGPDLVPPDMEASSSSCDGDRGVDLAMGSQEQPLLLPCPGWVIEDDGDYSLLDASQSMRTSSLALSGLSSALLHAKLGSSTDLVGLVQGGDGQALSRAPASDGSLSPKAALRGSRYSPLSRSTTTVDLRMVESLQRLVLEHTADAGEDKAWFARFFAAPAESPYGLYLADDPVDHGGSGACFVAVLHEDDGHHSLYRVVVFTAEGKSQHVVFASALDGDGSSSSSSGSDGAVDRSGSAAAAPGAAAAAGAAAATTSKHNVRDVLRHARPELAARINRRLKRVREPASIEAELVRLESNELKTTFKIGVLLALQGQTEEEEMFSNTADQASPQYDQFLDILGDRVALKDFAGYVGGLDTTADMHGSHFVHAQLAGNEIAFHVSTLLPYERDDPQQLSRKRHLGNDVCLIVFVDGRTAISPDLLSSHFVHVVAAVQPVVDDQGRAAYRIAIGRRKEVPRFGPFLTSRLMPANQTSADFLLTKLINGERAVQQSPVFQARAAKHHATLLQLYADQLRERHRGATEAVLVSERAHPIPRRRTEAGHARASSKLSQGGAGRSRSRTGANRLFAVSELVSFGFRVVCLERFDRWIFFGTPAGLYIKDMHGYSPPAVVSQRGEYASLHLAAGRGLLIAHLSSSHETEVYTLASVTSAGLPEVSTLPGTKRAQAVALVGDFMVDGYDTLVVAAVKKELHFFDWTGTKFVEVAKVSLPVAPTVFSALAGRLYALAWTRSHGTTVCEVSVPALELSSVWETSFAGARPLGILPTPDAHRVVVCLDKYGVVHHTGDGGADDHHGQSGGTRSSSSGSDGGGSSSSSSSSRPHRHVAFKLQWESTATSVAYAWPFFFLSTGMGVEVRTLLNGALLQRIPERHVTLFSLSDGAAYSVSHHGGRTMSQISELMPLGKDISNSSEASDNGGDSSGGFSHGTRTDVSRGQETAALPWPRYSVAVWAKSFAGDLSRIPRRLLFQPSSEAGFWQELVRAWAVSLRDSFGDMYEASEFRFFLHGTDRFIRDAGALIEGSARDLPRKCHIVVEHKGSLSARGTVGVLGEARANTDFLISATDVVPVFIDSPSGSSKHVPPPSATDMISLFMGSPSSSVESRPGKKSIRPRPISFSLDIGLDLP